MFTIVKGVVNMTPAPVVLSNEELPGSPRVTADPYSVASCNWNVPWVESQADFALGHRLVLTFADLRPSQEQPASYTYHIWQRGQFVEFVLGIGSDYPGTSARRLAGSRNGQPFFIEAMTDPEVVIIVTYVNEAPWVIMSRIGYNYL